MIRVRRLRKRSLLIRLLSLVFGLLVIAGYLAWVISGKFYEGLLSERVSSDPAFEMRVEDFDGLQRTRYEFLSDQAQRLTGYLYYTDEAPRGIIIFSHDLGCGHNNYMDCANYFAQNGYYVFAFDGTGYDESEGEGIRGLRQGVIDLDYAISFVESSGKFPELPIGLFGHGLGGYSVCAVLGKHPEVKAVVSCSGCDNPSDFVRTFAENAVGGWSHLLIPLFKMHDRNRFGDDAGLTAMDGLDASEAAVMIMNSEDNTSMPMKYGFDKFYEKYKDNPRFVFVRCTEGNHSPFIDSAYSTELHEKFKSWRKALDYNYSAEENVVRYKKEEGEFWAENLDRERWLNRLNPDVIGEMLSFFNENLH